MSDKNVKPEKQSTDPQARSEVREARTRVRTGVKAGAFPFIQT